MDFLGLKAKKQESIRKAYLQGKQYYDNEAYTDAYPLLISAANQGHAKAQYLIGRLYQYGDGVSQDDQKAFYWYQKSVDCGCPHAYSSLSNMYLKGKGTTVDINKGISCCIEAIKANSIFASLDAREIARSYENGDGVKQDLAKALTIYRNLAEYGEDIHQFEYGRCFRDGKGVPQNHAEAFLWFSKASAQENMYASYELGKLYLTGKGTQYNPEEAARLFKQAADNYHSDSIYELGKLYETGTGVDYDPAMAVQLYLEAGKRHAPAAELKLANMFEKGILVPENRSKAIFWYLRAAYRGDDEAKTSVYRLTNTEFHDCTQSYNPPLSKSEFWLQCAVGAYNSGDYTLAMELFKEAGYNKNGYAAYIAAKMYLLPEFLDYQQAEEMARIARAYQEPRADELLPHIWFCLGNDYLVKAEEYENAYVSENYGKLDFSVVLSQARQLPEVKDCKEKAMTFLIKAANRDHVWAIGGIVMYYYWSFINTRNMNDMETACHWLERAEALGDYAVSVIIPTRIRSAYYAEIGNQYLESDPKKAVSFLRKAAEAGNPGSMYNLAVVLLKGEMNDLTREILVDTDAKRKSRLKTTGKRNLEEALKWATEAQKYDISKAAGLIDTIKNQLYNIESI